MRNYVTQQSQHALQIGHYVPVGHAQHAISLLFQKLRPFRIMAIVRIMRVSINLYHQLGLIRSKVGDERSDNFLPAKFHSAEALTA